jgi:DNA-binding response OmpR family regulator
MLDLARKDRETPAAVDRGSALMQVADEDLARIVSLLLRGSGFQVERFRDVVELQAAAARIGVSVVLIAGGAKAPGAHPLGGFVNRRDRHYLLVALVGGDAAAALAAGADHVIHLPFDPDTFTAEILRRLAPASPADMPSPAT